MKTKTLLATLAGLSLSASGLLISQPWKTREPGRVTMVDSMNNPVLINLGDGYGNRLSEHALKTLEEEHGVPRDVALRYDTRFAFENDIANLHSNSIAPEKANQYSSRFNVEDFLTIRNSNVDWLTPFEVNAFDKRYEAEEIRNFARAGIKADVANAYDSRFDVGGYGGVIIDLHNMRATPKVANAYLEKFNPQDVIRLVVEGITPETALQYQRGFDGDDVIKLRKAGISADEANKYTDLNERFGARIDGGDIIKFGEEGISFGDVETQAKKSFLERAVEE